MIAIRSNAAVVPNRNRRALLGRTEALYALGWDQGQLYEEAGIVFVVRRAEIDYRAPARLGDLVEVTTSVGRIDRARFVMDQTVAKGDKVLARMAITLVCVTRDGRPMRIPEPVARALAGLRKVET